MSWLKQKLERFFKVKQKTFPIELGPCSVLKTALKAAVVGEEAVAGVPRPLMAPMLEPLSSSKSSPPSVEPRKSFGQMALTFKYRFLPEYLLYMQYFL